ncbi:hypothetical protein PR202_gb07238 [Eleusine coracana subsp. coracana]|uniref:RNase H type-1 domain-containing protein n=1 Tax=Eleusine coracana subsp. coracana TaxID=191504 RepID=A0AAV5EAW4_ELECO|nr:hypothetical protein PR202_gb07238 [Eleusine coracana subsp. coracana]
MVLQGHVCEDASGSGSDNADSNGVASLVAKALADLPPELVALSQNPKNHAKSKDPGWKYGPMKLRRTRLFDGALQAWSSKHTSKKTKNASQIRFLSLPSLLSVENKKQFELSTQATPGVVAPRWIKPNAEWVRINADGSFNSAYRNGGWGFIIRDQAGDVLGSGAGRTEHCHDALQAEAQGALEALQYEMSLGFAKVELEVDAVNLCEVLTSVKYDLATFRMIAQV